MFLDLVRQRQSCRAFLPKDVPRDLILKCVEAARLSPSACNSQPWHFVIADEPDLVKRLADSVFSGIYAMNAHAKTAPVLVAVVRERSATTAAFGGFFRGTKFNLIDTGIAAEHFCLQAAELGLSTCWLGWFDETKAKMILRIPWNKKIDCLISLGYPADTPREKSRKPLNEIHDFGVFRHPKKEEI